MIATVPLEHGMLLAAALVAVGLAGVLVRRNLLLMLVSLEVMMVGSASAFVMAGAGWNKPDGQVMFLFILAVTATETGIGLSLLLQLRRRAGTLDADALADADHNEDTGAPQQDRSHSRT